MLVPTTLLGAAFPAAARSIVAADRVASDVGALAALGALAVLKGGQP